MSSDHGGLMEADSDTDADFDPTNGAADSAPSDDADYGSSSPESGDEMDGSVSVASADGDDVEPRNAPGAGLASPQPSPVPGAGYDLRRIALIAGVPVADPNNDEEDSGDDDTDDSDSGLPYTDCHIYDPVYVLYLPHVL